MATRRSIPCLFVALGLALLGGAGCDKVADLAKDKEPATEAPPPEPIEAPARPAELAVRGGEISIIAVKDGGTEVAGRFTRLRGEATFDDGDLPAGLHGVMRVSIESFDSGNAGRDTNIEGVFFDAATHPTATVRLTSLDGLPEEGVAIGYDAAATAKGSLEIQGISTPIEAAVRLSRSAQNDYHLDSTAPVFLSIEDLKLTPRLKALMMACGHKSVDNNVRVSFRLDLGPKGSAPAEAAPNPAVEEAAAKGLRLPDLPLKKREGLRLPKAPPSQPGSNR